MSLGGWWQASKLDNFERQQRTSFCSKMEENWPMPSASWNFLKKLPQNWTEDIDYHLFRLNFLEGVVLTAEFLTVLVKVLNSMSEQWTNFFWWSYHGWLLLYRKIFFEVRLWTFIEVKPSTRNENPKDKKDFKFNLQLKLVCCQAFKSTWKSYLNS